MMTKKNWMLPALLGLVLAPACTAADEDAKPGNQEPPKPAAKASDSEALVQGKGVAAKAGASSEDLEARIERGRYLVSAGLCNDCHTPTKMGPNGPEPDLERLLSGHPESLVMPPAPTLPEGPWVASVSATMTAWNGPWGTTFTANLTPDAETGLGQWSEQNFVDTIRNGRRMGHGRPILPPMPVKVIANYTDDDLGAMFAYLQSLPPIKNKVPEPQAPIQNAAAPVKSGTKLTRR